MATPQPDTIDLPEPDDPRITADISDVDHVTRDEFLNDIFGPNYEPGEHVTFVGPTGSGKTTIAYEMLDEVATDDLPGIILVMKPRDNTVVDWTKKLRFKRVETWPPVSNRGLLAQKTKGGEKSLFGKHRGFVVWPRHSLKDMERDDKMLERLFRKVLRECYKKGDRIVFVDEVHGLQNELKLKPELDTIWMRGRSMGCALWAATQRPRHVSLNMYSQAEHLVLFKTPDMRDDTVYREIGGIDPVLVQTSVRSLKRFEFVYIGRSKGEDDEPTAIIVGA